MKAQPRRYFDGTTVRLTLCLPSPHAVDRPVSGSQRNLTESGRRAHYPMRQRIIFCPALA
ncbi:unnamed protein product [Mycetohabitans rhizoxinica HKI 454]|uniref:Uncharacterized protein n=1 Tax=Mycetohabitans rhizoxinica (strain DSM 19002 / CIP 109453 / HKI 454) TaxID=882378 RepID=E5ASG1_MYCRK|nr:unnamed protein product [Mycetohabitans rhizoxinica HKI 454]